ncbi:MAG: nitrilase-related carbon-nitrogen hydrolase, partial [Phenylobacterium sp.]
MRIALIQTRTPADQTAALDHVLPMVREAADAGARFILTPEGANILQKHRETLLPRLALQDDDAVVTGLREAARTLRVTIDIGSALVLRGDGKVANRQILIGPDGDIAATYDKLHM